jgi:hypothetical protein
MRRHFRNLNLALSARSHPESSAKRRDFRRDEAYELRSESQTELHNKINVEYVFEIKHSDQEQASSLKADSEAEKRNSTRKTHFLVSEEGAYPRILAYSSATRVSLSNPRSLMFTIVIF